MSGKILSATMIIAGLAILIFQNRSKSMLDRYKEYPSIRQYLNRFPEFFEKGIIEKSENHFLSLIDYGFDPEIAFKLVVSRKNND